MDEAQGKVSGEGSTFLLLLNDEPSSETNGLDGKSRLHRAWEYKGEPAQPARPVRPARPLIRLKRGHLLDSNPHMLHTSDTHVGVGAATTSRQIAWVRFLCATMAGVLEGPENALTRAQNLEPTFLRGVLASHHLSNNCCGHHMVRPPYPRRKRWLEFWRNRPCLANNRLPLPRQSLWPLCALK